MRNHTSSRLSGDATTAACARACAALAAALLLSPATSSNVWAAQDTEPAVAAKPAARAISVAFDKVSDACWSAIRSDGGGNAGFVVGETSVLVIDSLGKPELAEKLKAKIAEVAPDKPIAAIVHTQWHYEHTLGNQVFGDDVEILMGAKAATKFSKRLRADGVLLGPAGGAHASLNIRKVRPASGVIAKQRTFDLGGVAAVVAIAGACHSVEDIVVWVPDEKVLFAGDLVWNGHHPILTGGSTFRTIDSLARLERLPVAHVVPGHGPVDDNTCLATQREYLTNLRAMVKHLGQNEISAEAIAGKLDMPDEYSDLGHAAVWRENVLFVVREVFSGR